MPGGSPLLPLNDQRAFYAVDSQGARSCLADFYRHFYRQPVRHQHWRRFPGGSVKAHLSRSIEIYRDLSRSIEIYRDLSTPETVTKEQSTRMYFGQEGVKKRSASISLSYCTEALFRHIFYRLVPQPRQGYLATLGSRTVSRPSRRAANYQAASTPMTRRWPSRPMALAIRGSLDP